jgi:hypothetical protein
MVHLYEVGRIEDLEIVKLRAEKSSDREVWEVLEQVTEEIPLLWGGRNRDPVFEGLSLGVPR